MDLAKWIRTERARRGWSQRKLGNKLQTDPGSISRLERGLHDPDLRRFRRLCLLFAASADEVLGVGEHAPRRNADEGQAAS
jgi:transcriptional regulator with XRE-family HTH domain